MHLVLSDGSTLLAEGIGYLVKEEIETMEVPLEAGDYGLIPVASGTGTSEAWKVLVVYIRDKEGVAKMSIRATRVAGPWPEGTVTLTE